jgi:peptidoglycan/LPS O-acetylase OafA/YrhL
MIEVIGSFSKITYEFFLTHGPIFLGLSRLLELGFYQNLVLGSPMAIGAALILHALSTRIETVLRRRFSSNRFDLRTRLAAVENLVGSRWASPNPDHAWTEGLSAPQFRLEECQTTSPPG